MFNPNQLSFDYEPVEEPAVHAGQMSLDDFDFEKDESVSPVRYPSIEIGKRALHLSRAIQAELDYSRANGFVKQGEAHGLSPRDIDRRVGARDAYGRDADAEFDSAWGPVDDLVEAGFDKDKVLSAKAVEKNDFEEHMSVKNRRPEADGRRKAMARRMKKLKKYFDDISQTD
jgi:hypothetical protein